MESPAVEDDGDCFSPLLLNATSVNIEVYYNKAVNYTLMVTFVSFVQHQSRRIFFSFLQYQFFKGHQSFVFQYFGRLP